MFALAARKAWTGREDLIADDPGKCPNEPQRKAKHDSLMSIVVGFVVPYKIT
jgi:hypothetical protein